MQSALVRSPYMHAGADSIQISDGVAHLVNSDEDRINQGIARLLDLTAELDGIQDGSIDSSGRLKSHLEEGSHANKVWQLFLNMSPRLSAEIERLIENQKHRKNEGKGPKIRNPVIINTQPIVPIDEDCHDEILAITAEIRNIQESCEHIFSIAPYYIVDQERAIWFAERFFLFELWRYFPEYLGTLVPEEKMCSSKNFDRERSAMILCYSNILPDIAVWHRNYPEGENPKKELAQIVYRINTNLQKIKTHLTHEETTPDLFPFLYRCAPKHADKGVASFEKILLLHPWVGRYLIGTNAQQLNQTIIRFLQKYRQKFLDFLNNGTRTPLVDELVGIFGEDKLKQYITKHCREDSDTSSSPVLPRETKKPRQASANSGFNAGNFDPSLAVRIRQEGTRLDTVPVLPDGYFLEYTTELNGGWNRLVHNDISHLLGDIYDEVSLFLRVAMDPNIETSHQSKRFVVIPDQFKYKSPELSYLSGVTPSLANKFTLSQVFLHAKKLPAKQIITNWSYTDVTQLGISFDEGTTWQYYHPDELLQIRDFHAGKIYFAVFSLGEPPKIGSKTASIYLEKKVEDVVRGTEINTHNAITPPQTRNEAPYEVRALDLLGALTMSEYTISGLPDNTYTLTFSGESTPSFSFSPEKQNVGMIIPDSEFSRIFPILRTDVQSAFTRYISEQETQEDLRLSEKLKGFEKYVKRLFTQSQKLIESADKAFESSEIFALLTHNTGFSGTALLLNGKKILLENCIEQCRELGIRLVVDRVRVAGAPSLDPRGNDIMITLSFEDEQGSLGTIYSTRTDPGYSVSISGNFSENIRQKLQNLLLNLLISLGFMGEYDGVSALPKNKFTIDDISKVVRGKSLRNSNGSMSPEKRELVKEAYERFKRGKGKLCFKSEFDHARGYFRADIHGKQGLSAIADEEQEIEVLLTDGKLSSVPAGRKVRNNVYDFLKSDKRIQKYLVRKILSTVNEIEAHDGGVDVSITKVDKDGKSPFTGTMLEEFLNYWKGIDEVTRRDFIDIAKESPEVALDVEYQGVGIVDGLREHWRNAKVEIMYSRPHLVSLDEFLVLVGNL